MPGRTFGWWFVAQSVCARLTLPRTDVVAADWRFERLLRGSRLWTLGAKVAVKLQAAWFDSRLRSLVRVIEIEWPSERLAALRVIGWVMFIAGVITVIVQTFKSTGRDAFSWAVPVGVAAGGFVLWCVAGRTIPKTDLRAPEEP